MKGKERKVKWKEKERGKGGRKGKERNESEGRGAEKGNKEK